MTTIVNNPSDTSSGGMNFLIGAILLIVFVVFLLYFILPAINRGTGTGGETTAPQIQIPDQIDVNVKPQQ